MKKEILRLEDINTSENSIKIVHDADFHVFEGETVGLVGMSYAGKSSFIGAATGEYVCDSGKIWIQEKRKKIDSIQRARKEGIFLIKDRSSLIDEFTIKDTMHLNFAFVGKKTRYSTYLKKCKDTLKLVDISESEDTYIGDLNLHKRVLIEIAQALVCNAKLIVLDSVISLLSNVARMEFLHLFQKLKSYNVSFILIENQIDLIEKYLDRLCVMRRGRVVAELLPEEFEKNLVLSLSEGGKYVSQARVLPLDYELKTKKTVLEFQNIMTEDRVISDLSFSLHEGELLGIWNKNRHSGQAISDLLEGKRTVKQGKILCDDVNCMPCEEGWIYKYKIYLIPEDDKLCSNMSIGENIGLAALKKNAAMGIVTKDGELKYLIQNLCEAYFGDKGMLLFPDQMVPDSQLASKKISLCRAVAADAQIIVYNNPVMKMDIRERELFMRDIMNTQKRGISQILISSQIELLYPFCNRIIQVDEGKNGKEIQIENNKMC